MTFISNGMDTYKDHDCNFFFLQRLETIASLASYSYMDSLQLLHSLFPTSRRSTLLEERYFKWAEHSSTIELRNKTASLAHFQLLLTSTAVFAAATTKVGVLNLFFPVVLDQKRKALFFCSFFSLLGFSSPIIVFFAWSQKDFFLCGFIQPGCLHCNCMKTVQKFDLMVDTKFCPEVWWLLGMRVFLCMAYC